MQSLKSLLTGRFGLVYSLMGIYLLVGAALRVLLWWQFAAAQVSASELFWIMPTGLINDAIQAAYLSLPLTLYLFAMPAKWLCKSWARGALALGCIATLTALMFISASEYFFFEEFNSRFNLVAFDYLMYPTEVIGDIRAEYPVGLVLLAALVFAGAVTWLLRSRLAFSTGNAPLSMRTNTAPVMAQSLIVAVAGSLISTNTMANSIGHSVEWVLGRSENRIAVELADNGLSSFFQAARTNEISYPAFYATRDAKQNFATLTDMLGHAGGALTQLDQGKLTRHIAANKEGLGRLNVIVVAEESFGAEFSKLHGSMEDLTPNFDAFARQGMWFRNAYASGTRTVRGLEAIAASFPPIPSVSILRRPNNEHIATWGGVMRKLGYHVSFVYGGYGYFDNMNYFFGNNDHDVVDRTDIEASNKSSNKTMRFANIWGVSDEDLFDYALAHFDRQAADGQPFYSLVMTTSNHKPYTFREGVPGVPANGGGRAAGVRYADFALGNFLRAASQHAWFDNTLFVVVADHGARVYGKAEIPLRSYEIPLMIYSPRHVKPQRIDTLTGQIDIAPTVLALLGVEYDAPFFGTNVLSAEAQDPAQRFALFSHNHDVALYRDGKLSLLGLGKKAQTLTYNRELDRYVRVDNDAELTNLAIAIYQSAYEQYQSHRYE